jgi:transposase
MLVGLDLFVVAVRQPLGEDADRLLLAKAMSLQPKVADVTPTNITLEFLPPCSPELNPQENVRDEICEKKSSRTMDEVCDKLEEAVLYIERNPKMVKSITVVSVYRRFDVMCN